MFGPYGCSSPPPQYRLDTVGVYPHSTHYGWLPTAFPDHAGWILPVTVRLHPRYGFAVTGYDCCCLRCRSRFYARSTGYVPGPRLVTFALQRLLLLLRWLRSVVGPGSPHTATTAGRAVLRTVQYFPRPATRYHVYDIYPVYPTFGD